MQARLLVSTLMLAALFVPAIWVLPTSGASTWQGYNACSFRFDPLNATGDSSCFVDTVCPASLAGACAFRVRATLTSPGAAQVCTGYASQVCCTLTQADAAGLLVQQQTCSTPWDNSTLVASGEWRSVGCSIPRSAESPRLSKADVTCEQQVIRYNGNGWQPLGTCTAQASGSKDYLVGGETLPGCSLPYVCNSPDGCLFRARVSLTQLASGSGRAYVNITSGFTYGCGDDLLTSVTACTTGWVSNEVDAPIPNGTPGAAECSFESSNRFTQQLTCELQVLQFSAPPSATSSSTSAPSSTSSTTTGATSSGSTTGSCTSHERGNGGGVRCHN